MTLHVVRLLIAVTETDGGETKKNTFIPAAAEFSGALPKRDVVEFLEWLKQNLPEYKPGSPDEPGEGYTQFGTIDAPKSVRNSPLEDSMQIAKIRYQKEEYEENEAYVDGEFRMVHTREVDSADVFWANQIVLFQGSRSASSAARSKLQTKFINDLRIQAVHINPGIYRDLQSLPLKYVDQLELEDTLSVSVKGAGDVSQMRLSGRADSNMYDKYFPEHGKVSHLINDFRFYNYRIVSSISNDSIHIYSLNHPHRSVDSSERLFVSLLFLIRLVDISLERKES